MVDISYIVSAYNRPMGLQLALLSLLLQTHQSFEIIVTDNWEDTRENENERVCNALHDSRICYMRTFATTCYHSAEIGAQHAKGEYLCFPSDDSYYMPLFAETLLATGRDLVYCNTVYDRRLTGRYETLTVTPTVGRFDKTCFLLRRHLFAGFPGKPIASVPAPCDGLLAQQLINHGVSHSKIDEVLLVHN